jgi:hypothetical protein
MASYQITVLNTITSPADGSFQVTGVFCLTAPSNAIVPIPGFKSQNPYIDEATLLGLQNGQYVEQSFNSGQFDSGTSLATVQALLQSLFTTAQTTLTNTNPALSGLVATYYNGTSWFADTAPNVFLTAATVIDFDTAVLLGRIPGAISGRAQGYVSTSGTSNVAVRATTYTPQGTNAQRSIVSTSANDTSAGTGARTITINYLDTSFVLHAETVTLNGTTPVNTVGTNIAYIESLVVATVGSGQVNAGTINLLTATGGGGSVWASANPGDQGTFWAHHYVPAGVTCYVSDLTAGGTVVSGVCNLIHQQSLATPGAPTVQIGTSIVHPAGGQWDHEFEISLPVTGPDLIWVNELPTASTANKTWAGFEYVQF